MISDIVVGAISHGVNTSTLVLLNAVMALAFVSLLFLLAASMVTSPALVPHVCVLMVLALGLWGSINWLILNVGLVDPKQQEKELFGQTAAAPAEGDQPPGAAGEDGSGQMKQEAEQKKDQ